jgi:hypothetical protein
LLFIFLFFCVLCLVPHVYMDCPFYIVQSVFCVVFCCLRPVSCAPRVYGLSILYCPISFLCCVLFVCVLCLVPHVYMDCPFYIVQSVFCVVFCCLCPVSCAPRVYGLSILYCPISFLCCVLFVCVLCLVPHVYMDCPFYIVQSVFCVVFCCLSPVSCAPRVYGLSILYCPISFLCCVLLSLFCVLFPMLPVYMDCPFLIVFSVFHYIKVGIFPGV